VTLNHVRRGEGEPLLLIHGIGGEWRAWEPLLDRLAAEREVIAIDVPGFGRSAPLGDGRRPTPPALAEAVAQWLRREVGSEPIDVAGHSMGGWISLELAKLGMARRVVAIAPAGFFNRVEAEWGRAVLTWVVWWSRHNRAFLRELIARPRGRALPGRGQFRDPAGVSPAAMMGVVDALAASTAYDETRDAMQGGRFSGGDEVRAPVTLVWGTRDGLLLPRQAKRAASEIPGAALVWVEGGGHFAHWDDPELVVRAILER
jgi:pimeloyl-ACP methyl ester carboxylesterase